jgi:hypothetical protein
MRSFAASAGSSSNAAASRAQIREAVLSEKRAETGVPTNLSQSKKALKYRTQRAEAAARAVVEKEQAHFLLLATPDYVASSRAELFLQKLQEKHIQLTDELTTEQFMETLNGRPNTETGLTPSEETLRWYVDAYKDVLRGMVDKADAKGTISDQEFHKLMTKGMKAADEHDLIGVPMQ